MIPVTFRPWMIWAAAVGALVLLLGVQTVRLAGAQSDLAVEAKAHAETKRQHAEALAAAIQEAREREHAMQADIEKIQAAAAKERLNAKSREDALVESVRSGERRLRIAAVCTGGGKPGLRAPVASGGGAEVQVAELDGAASERILRIGFDGDQAIRERNACVAAYEAVRARINQPEQSSPAQ